jgi:hypothetical protein
MKQRRTPAHAEPPKPCTAGNTLLNDGTKNVSSKYTHVWPGEGQTSSRAFRKGLEEYEYLGNTTSDYNEAAELHVRAESYMGDIS